MEFGVELSRLSTAFSLAEQNINLEEYSSPASAEGTREALAIIDDTIKEILNGLNGRNDQTEATRWSHTLNATMFAVAVQEECSAEWTEHFEAVVYHFPAFTQDFYFDLIVRHHWLPHFVHILGKLQDSTNQEGVFQSFLQYLSSQPLDTQQASLVAFLRFFVLYDNPMVNSQHQTANRILSDSLETCASMELVEFSVEDKVTILAACGQICSPRNVLRNHLENTCSKKPGHFSQTTLENMTEFVFHQDHLIQNLAELVEIFTQETYEELTLEKLLYRQQLEGLNSDQYIVNRPGHFNEDCKKSASSQLTRLLNEPGFISEVCDFAEECLDRLGDLELYKMMERVFIVKGALEGLKGRSEIEEEKISRLLERLKDTYDGYVRDGAPLDCLEYTNFWITNRDKMAMRDNVLDEYVRRICTLQDATLLQHERWLTTITTNQSIFATPSNICHLLHTTDLLPRPELQASLDRLLVSMATSLPLEELSALVAELGKRRGRSPGEQGNGDGVRGLWKQEEFEEELRQCCNRLTMEEVMMWSSKVTVLFLQDAQQVLDKLLEELLLSGHLPAIVAKIFALVPSLLQWPSTQDATKAAFVVTLREYLQRENLPEKQRNNLTDFILCMLKQKTDTGHLLSLRDFLSDCLSPSMHHYYPQSNNHASHFPASITLLHTLLVDNLLSVEDSLRQRLESEGGLASVLVGYLEFLARVLEDIQQEGELGMEGIHVKSKAVEIFQALQKSLARNVHQIENKTWLYNMFMGTHDWRTQLRAADFLEAICTAAQLEYKAVVPPTVAAYVNLPPVYSTNITTMSDDSTPVRVLYDILDVVRLSDEMQQVVLDGWRDCIPTLDKQYVSWQQALVSHLRTCLPSEWHRLARFLINILESEIQKCPAEREGEDCNAEEIVRTRLSSVLLDAMLVLIETTPTPSWRLIMDGYCAVVDEYCRSNDVIPKPVLQDILYLLHSLHGQCDEAITDQLFTFFLLRLIPLLKEAKEKAMGKGKEKSQESEIKPQMGEGVDETKDYGRDSTDLDSEEVRQDTTSLKSDENYMSLTEDMEGVDRIQLDNMFKEMSNWCNEIQDENQRTVFQKHVQQHLSIDKEDL